MPPELARQPTHEIPQLASEISPHLSPASSNRMGPNGLLQICRNDPLSGQIDGSKWLCRIFKIIWTQVHDEWETQNAACYGTITREQKLAKYKLAKQEILALYKHHHKVLPRDFDLFYTTTEEHFAQEPTSQGLQQWLHTWKPVLLQSIQEGPCTRTNQTQYIS